MFKVKKIKKIKWPVKINEPQDGGETKEQTFTVELELISQKEYDAFYDEEGEKDIGLIRRVVTGFGDGLCDEFGNPLEFNAENKEELVTTAYIRNGIIRAYVDCIYGKAAEKNEPMPPGIGRHDQGGNRSTTAPPIRRNGSR